MLRYESKTIKVQEIRWKRTSSYILIHTICKSILKLLALESRWSPLAKPIQNRFTIRLRYGIVCTPAGMKCNFSPGKTMSPSQRAVRLRSLQTFRTFGMGRHLTVQTRYGNMICNMWCTSTTCTACPHVIHCNSSSCVSFPEIKGYLLVACVSMLQCFWSHLVSYVWSSSTWRRKPWLLGKKRCQLRSATSSSVGAGE